VGFLTAAVLYWKLTARDGSRVFLAAELIMDTNNNERQI
jgi:hypothetical protein